MADLDKVQNYEESHEYTMLEYLPLGRQALLSHPLFSKTVRDHVNSAYCRLAVMAVVSAVEAVLEAWSENGPKARELWDTYEDDKKSNGDRIGALFEAFNSAGVQVERDTLDKYLAIKYLRNRIVHPEPSDAEKKRTVQRQREFIKGQGFPAEYEEFPMGFSEDHWRLIWDVFWKMRNWIYRIGFLESGSPLVQLLGGVEAPSRRVEEELRLIRPADLPQLWRFNIEAINSQIAKHMEEVVLEDPGYSREFSERVAGIPMHEVSLVRSRICQKAAEDGFTTLTQDRSLAALALASWKEWWTVFEAEEITIESIEHSLSTVQDLHETGQYLPPVGWARLPREALTELVAKSLRGLRVPAEQIADALKVGQRVYALRPLVAAEFFAIRGPAVNPAGMREYGREGLKALSAAELASTWCGYAEALAPPKENLVARHQAWRDK